MTFKFKNIEVEITDDGELICSDKSTYDLLLPLIENVNGSPEQGDPYVAAITEIFGEESVTDVQPGEETIF